MSNNHESRYDCTFIPAAPAPSKCLAALQERTTTSILTILADAPVHQQTACPVSGLPSKRTATMPAIPLDAFLDDKFQQRLKGAMARWAIPGISIALTHGDGHKVVCLGERDVGLPMTPRVGSSPPSLPLPLCCTLGGWSVTPHREDDVYSRDQGRLTGGRADARRADPDATGIQYQTPHSPNNSPSTRAQWISPRPQVQSQRRTPGLQAQGQAVRGGGDV